MLKFTESQVIEQACINVARKLSKAAVSPEHALMLTSCTLYVAQEHSRLMLQEVNCDDASAL